ncbi:hypothetical protein IAR55_001253 [Kwoniella newhampshirensis]|uniref:Nuclear DNA helicase II n=1 Tax=Kwoniella newhampshirensis TaxID=1651941 RepID=A0AAW0Z584_9TREE
MSSETDRTHSSINSRPIFSLPSKPVVAAPELSSRPSLENTSSNPVSSLASRLVHALPARPTFSAASASHAHSTQPRGLRSPSPLKEVPTIRREFDSYHPSPSPPPSIRREKDVYIPSPPRGIDHPHRLTGTELAPRLLEDTGLHRRPSPRPRSPSPHRRSSPYIRSPSPIRRRGRSTSKSRSHSRIRANSSRHQGSGYGEYHDSSVSLKDRLGGFLISAKEHHTSTSPAPKRPLSPSALPSQLPNKVAKAIPTGPRVSQPVPSDSASSIPTGPRATRIPTGPRALQTSLTQQQPQITSLQTEQSPAASDTRLSRSPSPTSDMPGPSRYRSNGHTTPRRNGGSGGNAASAKQLAPPLHDQGQIMSQFGNGITLKPQWAENPKAPLANFLGGGRGGADMGSEYQTDEGIVAGKKVFRVTVAAEADQNIYGVGDHPNKKEAEKLAALSAVLQLTAAGILERGKPGGKPVAPSTANTTSQNLVPGGSSETAILSDGSQISYDRARQFMEYYCQRYKFGKPDIEFSQTATKSAKKGKAANMVWDAVITVGGRRIGMGSASNKKGAQVKCYLDVTQYLESCDPELWKDFLEYSKKDKSANLGMAPHLVFQMSDALNEDIQGLCGDIRHSRLWENAPSSGVAANEPQPLPTWSQGRQGQASERELQDKSLDLQDRLAAYQSDPKLEKMRKTRQSLPVTSRATEILAKIEVNEVTIVMAATGSGKTTQVPQLLFDDYINRGEGAKCNIVCTQPRRLAAMSVAERIADERGQQLGQEVGYQVRFDVKLPQSNGSITFCTTGIFLKRMQSALGATADPVAVSRMDEVTHIVVDEVHERDIDTDLLLVVLKRLLADRRSRNKPIKIILMSATIDPTLFKQYFTDPKGRLAPVAEVPGRTFPVERHYLDDVVPQLQGLPANKGGWVFSEKNVVEYIGKELSRDPSMFVEGTGMELEIPYPLVALTIADVMQRSGDGHVLVFLPGWDEIKKVADILLDGRRYPLMGLNFSDSSKYSIHYLHSTIPAAEQKEVFRPPPEGVRRIILATNIAETSITIPDVVYVVDTARVKEKRYDPDRHMSSLVSAWVGSSNLNQRAGRAGRHRDGEYYGLVSKNRLASLDPHQLVEMKRSDLSNVVMHVKALNLGEVEEVLAATIEPPESNRIVAAMDVLRMLGAIDVHQNLTSLGRVLLQLPVEAAIGKLCLYGSFFRCLDSALTLAAVLTNRDPFLAPIALKKQADEIKDSWSPVAFRSDPLAITAAYNVWSAMDDRGEYRSANQFCSDNFLSKPTMLQIKQVKGSLLQSLDQAGVIAVSAGGMVGRIGRQMTVPAALNEHGNSLPLLAALIAMASAPNFALRTSEKTCRTSQDKTVFIHASSVNSRRREVGGPEEPSASFNPAEKRLYAFGEKQRNVPPGGNPSSALTQLRVVTRLDPMTYMLFGAYELLVTQRGLECDRWLPVVGNLHALDDVQRLKVLLEGCMLRVFEGVGKSLVRGRDQRWRNKRDNVQVSHSGSSRIKVEDQGEEGENESDDEDEAPPQTVLKKRVAEPLSVDEIKELELLTTDVVRILDAYAMEREGGSVAPSRPATPGVSAGGFGSGSGAAGSGFGRGGGAAQGGAGGQGVYRPPQRGRY